MDIRNWPMDRILQLPDSCFGRRWPIGVSVREAMAEAYYDISEEALPEWCVIWNLVLYAVSMAPVRVCVLLALSDQLPTVALETPQYERIFRFGYMSAAQRYVVRVCGPYTFLSVPMRLPVHSAGRRLVASFTFHEAIECEIHAVITISSIPTEVPDWLISGRV